MLSLRPHQQRAFHAMQDKNAGQIIVPTGGGKTYIMIADTYKHLRDSGPQTIVVVAPRILLANQLCEEFMEHIHSSKVHVCHAHSGETHYFSSTKSDKLALFANTARAASESCIIFTTYHSLNRVVESGIDIDTIYFDEAHNGCGKHFFTSVFATAQYAKRRYYFTATPKTGRGVSVQRGMNNTAVWGGVLCNVPAKELIEAGAIVPLALFLSRPNAPAISTTHTRLMLTTCVICSSNLMYSRILKFWLQHHPAKCWVTCSDTLQSLSISMRKVMT